MSGLKRTGIYRGEIAVVSTDESDRPVKAKCFRQRLRDGAHLRAEELGFTAQDFSVGSGGLNIKRLDAILKARGIRGVMILPVWREPDLAKLDWRTYAGVYTDYLIERTALHTICADFYRSMLYVLKHAGAMGFRRPGLFLDKPVEERLHFCWSNRWASAFLGFQSESAAYGDVPPLIEESLDQNCFNSWFRRHRPDVVLGHRTEAIDWMKAAGAKVPETHAFISLNIALKDRPCAGLDLQPELLAATGVELLTAQILSNRCGLEEVSSATMIPGRWEDGPTLKRRIAVCGLEQSSQGAS